MSPEKAAKKSANLLMLAFKDTSPDDPSVQVGLIAHGYQPGPSGQRYLLRSEAFAATTKAARNLAQLIDLYPLEKCISLLRTFVVEEKDRGTPLPQVHENLRVKILQFLQSFASQGEWEVVLAVRGIDLTEGPFSVGPCSFSLMDDAQFHLWGRRFATGKYVPPESGPVFQEWFQHESALRGQVVAAARVRATDQDHASAKGRKRIEEVINLLRYGQLVVGFPERPFPEVGLWAKQWQHDHGIVIRLDKPNFGTNQMLGGPAGNQYSMSKRAPGWDGLEQLVRLDLSARNDLQLRLTTALEWVGQAALAPSAPIRLVALVTALEALLIEESESLGKKTKLANRVAKLVAPTSAAQQAVAKEVEEMYEARSECVHAGLVDVEKDELKKVARLIAKTVDGLYQPPFSTMLSLGEVLQKIEPAT